MRARPATPAASNRVEPTPRAVLVLTAGLAAALLPVVVSSRLWTVWPAFLGVFVLGLGFDALRGLSARGLRVDLDLPETLYVGDSDPARIRLQLRGGPATRIHAHLDLGPTLAPRSLDSALVPAGGTATLEVMLTPSRRGLAEIAALWLRWSGPLGLVRHVHRRPIDRSIPVLPDVRAVKAAALLAVRAPEVWSGLRQARHVGEGSEFESLREFLPGLDHRTIDWKASARHHKLLSRDFRAERDRPLVLALDCGHLMGESVDGVPKLDRAINAGLHLAMVGLRTGDRVGLFAFDERVRAFREPRGGISTFPELLRLSVGLDYSTGESNFTLGLLQLSLRLRRRSLVVLLTDFVDSVAAELMAENLDRLARRHLVLCVTLRDPGLDRIADAAPRTLDDVHRSVVARDLIRERQVVLRRLQRLGVRCIDAPPAAVTASLLNRYLAIKRRELVG